MLVNLILLNYSSYLNWLLDDISGTVNGIGGSRDIETSTDPWFSRDRRLDQIGAVCLYFKITIHSIICETHLDNEINASKDYLVILARGPPQHRDCTTTLPRISEARDLPPIAIGALIKLSTSNHERYPHFIKVVTHITAFDLWPMAIHRSAVTDVLVLKIKLRTLSLEKNGVVTSILLL